MKCSDIPTEPILEFLKIHGGMGCSWIPIEIAGDRSVLNAMPAGIPTKLALAKMRKLIKKKLVTGCACGCRGDFDLPL